MTLISSISGIRGTIGGAIGDNLTPVDIVNYTSAYAAFMKKQSGRPKVVVGRDGRSTGATVKKLITGTLLMSGVDVVDIDYTTTPTIEMAIIRLHAEGGIMISASHNPMQWNALKLLNGDGEFISAQDGNDIKTLIEEHDFHYCGHAENGQLIVVDDMIDYHIDKILELPYVDVEAIRSKHFRVAVDTINSTGSISVKKLLIRLGVNEKDIFCINDEMNGTFAHNPEPLEANLTDLGDVITSNHCHLGIAVDPDVDRLAFMQENGKYFGEEYTIVACADYVLSQKPGSTVSNLSSSRALRDVTTKYGEKYYASAVGEVNVVKQMKAVSAIIGGEGNGGVILPELHYGRDALLGIALMLSYLAKNKLTMSQLRALYPSYYMAKKKINLKAGVKFADIKDIVKKHCEGVYNEEDGLKIDFDNSWVHLRTSNTEPIIRIYTEAKTVEESESLAQKVMKMVEDNM